MPALLELELPMEEMTGAEAIVQCLKQHGVDTIFGLPGVQLDSLFDALYHERDSIRVIHTRHEQAAGFMAFGFAQSTGKVGVCLVVPGPGILNASAALSTAYACNTPVLALTGQIPANRIDKGIGFLHEIPDQLGMLGSVTKWAARANTPAEAPALLQEAFKQLKGGRNRPVALEMAMDVMGHKSEVRIPEAFFHDEIPEGDPDLIETAAKVLAEAKNPMIIAGGGALKAGPEIVALAESLQAPVTMSKGGKGAISENSYLALNRIASKAFWKKADVILAIGTRLVGPITMWGWGIDNQQRVIRIDIDPEVLNRLIKPEVAIVADACQCLQALVNRVAAYNIPRKARKDEFLREKEKSYDFIRNIQPQASYAEVLRQELPDDGILVTEMTQMGYFLNVCFPIYYPRRFIHSGYQGTLGFGFATALGVQCAHPGKKVISISGDGGFLYTGQELSTALRHNINLVAVVFSNDAYGNVLMKQKESFGGRTIASDLLNPDFVKYAESFGAMGIRAESPKTLRKAIQEGFKADTPTLIEVPLHEISYFGMYY